jgi:ribosome-associated protein
MKKLTSLNYAQEVARVASQKLGQDIQAYDVRKLTTLTDYFVFIGATSHLHVRALEDEIRKCLSEAGAQLIRTDGQRGHLWRVLDYGSLFVHIMEQKTREFYGLERLWEQGKPLHLEGEEKMEKPTPKKKSKSPAKPRKKKSSTR